MTIAGREEIGKTEKGLFADIGLVELQVDALRPLWTVLLQHAGSDQTLNDTMMGHNAFMNNSFTGYFKDTFGGHAIQSY